MQMTRWLEDRRKTCLLKLRAGKYAQALRLLRTSHETQHGNDGESSEHENTRYVRSLDAVTRHLDDLDRPSHVNEFIIRAAPEDNHQTDLSLITALA